MELAEDRIRSVVAHLAHLRAAYGDAFAAPDLVEPTGDFFPDEFRVEPEAIARLLERMRTYAPLSEDIEVGVGFVEPEAVLAEAGGCGASACGTGGLKEIARGGAVETEDGYAVLVHVKDATDPTILTTALARGLGRVVLFEADEAVRQREEGPLSELTAVAAGLGILMLNGSCVYKKGCGGMSRHQATHLDPEELALALALFIRVSDKKAGTVRRHLEVTQKEAFDAAVAWVDGQPTLVRALRDRPETLEDGVFSFEEKKGLLSRLFARKADDDELGGPVKSTPRVRSEDEQRRLAEARALVDEALSEP